MSDSSSIKKILIIAGSDSGGGAGLQADIKVATVLNCYATVAVTAVTAQNTQTVSAIYPVSPDCVYEQITAVMSDIVIDVVKIGMVCNLEIAKAVYQALEPYQEIPVILDPVMISTTGHALLQNNAINYLKEFFFPRVTLLTPNCDEAALLTGRKIDTQSAMLAAAQSLYAMGVPYILVKGGHLPIDGTVHDLLFSSREPHIISHSYLPKSRLHGTGCALSTAIACGLAHGYAMEESVGKAIAYVTRAIEKTTIIGKGCLPLNHLGFDDTETQGNYF